MIRTLLLASITILSCLAQQPPPGETGLISGAVTGEDGGPVAGAYVTLHLAHKPSSSVRERSKTQWAVYSGSSGAFSFAGLPLGSYRLCIQAPETSYLDPCEWGLPIPTVTLTKEHPSSTLGIVLRKGAELPIRFEDQGQLLLQNEKKTPGAHLLVGARTATSTFRPAVLTLQEANGKTMKVVIPFDKRVNLEIASPFFKLADSVGIPFTKAGISTPVSVPTGQQPAPLKFSITGRK